MLLTHNQTESWSVDVMNTDNSSEAWVSMLAEGQFSNTWLGANFTDLITAGLDPWFYVEYRVDWTRDSINYYIGGQLMQSFTKELNGTLPSTPAPIRWQHWSLGNEYNSQGPPGIRSEADIGWTRIFFNSSLTTDDEHKAFDERCTPTAACRMDDNTLRGSSAIPAEALKPWKQHHPKWKVQWVPLIVDIVFGSLAVLFTMKTLWRRLSWAKVCKFLGISKEKPDPGSRAQSETTSDTESERVVGGACGSTAASSEDGHFPNPLPREPSYASFMPPPSYSGVHTPAPEYRSPGPSTVPSGVNSVVDLTIDPLPRTDSVGSNLHMRNSSNFSARASVQRSSVNAAVLSKEGSQAQTSSSSSSLSRFGGSSSAGTDTIEPIPHGLSYPPALSTIPSLPALVEPDPAAEKQPQVIVAEEKKPEVKAPPGAAGAAKPGPHKQQRVDYLAGFISISAVLVTMNHFGLTFWAGVIIPSVRPHYQSEIWARRTIATYFLDPLWIGPFLMISTRFLTSNYLRTGKLDNMAQKIVARPFRLLVPVASIATLEYFLMDAGALNWLEYLASVTWSPWPFTTIVQNPGVFLSELIQLAYLIPNAAPMITTNYCTGVLWTIPVQLQGAWQTLLALIMVRECKTPWKRFAFYAFCVSQHWYGLSWGSYYYAGVFLADIDITFKYKDWLHPRPWVYYPFLWFLIAVTLGGFTLDTVTQWTGVNYAEVEYGWHPDIESGLSIEQSGNTVYPDYFIPRLNALLTTVAMQMVVEISPALQKVLSIKPLQWLFPHVFTIYLIHGFIFWSIGSWAMVTIFSYGAPYWLCVLLTVIICYGTLLGSLPLLTPPIEMLGKKLTLSIWEHASEEPVPRKPTTFPFGKELLSRDPASPRISDAGNSSFKGTEGDTSGDYDEKGKSAARVTKEEV